MKKSVYFAKPFVKSSSIQDIPMPKYESEFLNCPYCSEKMKLIVNRDVSLGEPPPQQMECIIDVLEWFIPEYPQFLRLVLS